MSSVFYIETVPPQGQEPEFFELALTTDFNLSYRSRVTQSPVESGATVADHVVNEPVGLSYSGFISNVKNLSLDYQKTISETIEGVLSLRDSKTPFIVHFDNNLDALPNSIFTELVFSKTSGDGEIYRADISTQQLLITEAATETSISEQDPIIARQHSEKSENSDNNTEKVSEDSVRQTLLVSGAVSASDVSEEAFGEG